MFCGVATTEVLMNVAAEVFDNPINPALANEFLEDPRHHIAIAIDDGLVVGFGSGVDYIHPDNVWPGGLTPEKVPQAA
jgi:hypothetical protein